MKTITKKRNEKWQLQEAKAMFSNLVKAAYTRPQIITVRGKETAVILSFEEYKNLSAPKQSLFDFIQKSPLKDFSLDLPQRQSEEMRQVKL